MKKINIKKYISLALSTITVATSLSLGCVAYADTVVEISEDNFTDKTFRSIISEYYDLDENGFLDSSERSRSVITLSAYTEDDDVIESLKGIEFFPNLQRLYAAGLGIKELNVSQNKALTQLTVGSNELQTITLGSLPNLTRLDCSANTKLTSLNLSGCPNLQQLQCYSCNLSSLNVSVTPMLNLLYVQQNNLTSLDVTRNTGLVTLYCSNNHIRELDLSANTNLEEITSDMIGDQWINEGTYVKTNKIYIDYALNNPSRLISSSLDTVVETDDGNSVVSAYNGSSFVCAELMGIKDHLLTPDHERIDGFTYNYDVNNSQCEPLTVNVVVDRNFYQVNFYLDETKNIRLGYSLVVENTSAISPQIPQAPVCKKFVSWSESFGNVTDDMDIYIVWADDHNINKIIDSETGLIDIHCKKCDRKTIRFNILDALNSKTGDENFVEIGDQNKDGVINAKDYAIIVRNN